MAVPRPHSATFLATVAVLGLALALGFAALGTWQLRRRVWKLDLIARVQARLHAPPVDAPGPPAWRAVTAEADGYRRVRVAGVYLPRAETRVLALTELGSGYWVMSPLRTSAGFTVLVNRGFIPLESGEPGVRTAGPPVGAAVVTGLLRISEPRGGVLQRNDPAHDLWYSRDVAAIAAARGLHDTAPYFIDADASPRGGYPAGGLTVVRFANSHLLYAVIWYALALLVVGAGARLAREEGRARRAAAIAG